MPQINLTRILCFSSSLLLIGCNHGLLNSEMDNEKDASQITLCHTDDGRAYHPLEDRPENFDVHLLHGDGIPSGPVPRMDGFVFTESCSATKDTDDGLCPTGMAHIEAFCIDRWEAHLQEQSPYEVPSTGVAQTAQGLVPQGYISGVVAEVACKAAGKRLCSSTEWLRTCQGPRGSTFPYGNTYRSEACNEGREQHPVVELFGAATDWSSRQMNDPRINQLPNSLASTGSHPACMSVEGVYDLHGNLHEWVADADGMFRGGFYVDAEINGTGCLYRTTAHTTTYHDYSTGFRCCADAQ